MRTYDLAIAGAGIIGLSIAWQIARRSRMRVLVVEKGASVGEGSTGASSAICRYRYSTDEMLNFARDGIHAYRNWAAFTGLKSPTATFNADGVLWMPGSDSGWAVREHTRLENCGIATALLDDRELADRFPGLNPCVIAPDLETGREHDCRAGGRHLLELDGGWIDPVAAASDLVEACRSAGVEVRFNTRVCGIEQQGGRISGIQLTGGDAVATPLLVNAAGPWCADLFAAAGLTSKWELTPTRIQVLYLDLPAEVPGPIPVAVDMEGGIYFRTQNRGQQLVVSSVLEEDEREAVMEPDHYRLEPDDRFQQLKLHLLHHRIPKLPYRGKVRGYCGLYTVNRDDVHPILGSTALEGFWVANGFSGHGFKLAPAVGSMLARAITGIANDFDTAVPLSHFSIDREPIVLRSKSVLA